MRSHVLALAAAATLLVSLAARADEDPFADPGPDDLPPLSALSELPPLPELPPLDEAEPAPAPAPAPVDASAPAPPHAPAAPAAVSIPATQSAVLGMYDEYRRSVGAFSIDDRPVSAAEYDRCVAAGKCARPSCTVAGSAPASCVDLAQAKAYCGAGGRRLPTEDEWERAAREATRFGLHGMTDGRLEWTGSPYCYFCGKDDEVARGGPTRNPRLRSWRPPGTHDATLGFRCAD